MERGVINKNMHYFLLLLISVIALLFRYPNTIHLLGSDAHFYCFLANSINQFGQAKWLIHPASYFGQYPFSDNAGYALFLSTVSQMGGVSVELSVLVITLFISVLGILVAFLFFRELMARPFFTLIGTFAFAMMPATISYSSWTITSRIFVVYLTPFLFFLLLRTPERSGRKYLALSLGVLVLLFLFHKMAYFILPVFLIYFISQKVGKISYMLPSAVSNYRKIWVPALFIVSFLVGVLPITNYDTSYEQGFLTGNGPVITLLNAVISLAGSTNVILLLSFFGLLFLLSRKERTAKQLFIITSIVLILPILQLRTYARPVVSLFLLILGIYGIYWFQLKLSRKKATAFILSFALVSLCFTGIMLAHWDSNPFGSDGAATPEMFSAITYSREIATPSSSFISNYWADGRLFQSYIGSPCLPSQAGLEKASYLIYGYVSQNEIKQNTIPISITDLGEYIHSQGPFSAPEMMSYYYNEIGPLLKTDASAVTSQRMMEKYNTSFILVNKEYPDSYKGRWADRPKPSPFFTSLATENYRVFDSAEYEMYYPMPYK